MLLSLGLGDLVYVLEFTVFTNRAEHPVSSLFIVLKPTLGIFLWSLKGGGPGRITFLENCIIKLDYKSRIHFLLSIKKFIIYVLRNTHQKVVLKILIRKWVLANQRSELWFSHVKKMIRPIRIANDVFSHVRKIIRPIRSHRGVWVSRQNSRLFLQLAERRFAHIRGEKFFSKSFSR